LLARLYNKDVTYDSIAPFISRVWNEMSEVEREDAVTLGRSILRQQGERSDSPLVRRYCKIVIEELAVVRDAEDEDAEDTILERLDILWGEMTEAERKMINNPVL